MNERQFSLRKLFVGITLVCALFGGVVYLTRGRDGAPQEYLATLLYYGLLVLPFVLVAGLAYSLAKRMKSPRAGWWFFLVSELVLGLNFYWGYADSQRLVAMKAWTGAALSFAMIIPRSLVVVIVCWIARHVIPRFKKNDAP